MNNKLKSIGLIIAVLFLFFGVGGAYLFTYQDRSISERDKVSELKKIEGSFGVLEVFRPGEYESRKLRLNERVFAINDHVGFYMIYPNISNPEVVVAWSDCGGSACGSPNHYLIDLKTTPPFISSEISEINHGLKFDDFGRDRFRLSGTSSYLKNNLGDYLHVSLIYDRKQKRVFFENVLKPERDFNSLVGTHPDNFLGNEKARQIFLETMAPEDFKELRTNMGTAGNVRAEENGRFIVGDGMLPHNGGDPAAFFIIDQVQNAFVAGIYDSGTIRLFANTEDFYSFTPVLNDELRTYGAIWDGKVRARTEMDDIKEERLRQFRLNDGL